MKNEIWFMKDEMWFIDGYKLFTINKDIFNDKRYEEEISEFKNAKCGNEKNCE